MIRILVVDDQNLIQQGIKSLLDQEREFKIIGAVNNGESAIRAINRLRPDIVLLDIEMPGMNGISVTKYINHFLPQTKVIILSTHEEKAYLVKALVAGAKAYILKDSLTADLKQAILAVNNGYSQIESRLLAKVINSERIKSVKHQAIAETSTENKYKVRSPLKLAKTTPASRQQGSNQNREAMNVGSNLNLSDGKPANMAIEAIASEHSTNPASEGALPVEVMPSVQKPSVQKTRVPTEQAERVAYTNAAPSKNKPTTTTYHANSRDRHSQVRITRSRRNSSSPQNQSALVPTTSPALTQNHVAFGSNLQKSRFQAISAYLDRLTDFPQIRPIKLWISKFFQPMIAQATPALRKYRLRLKQIFSRRDTQKYLQNVGLMILGGIIVLVLSSF